MQAAFEMRAPETRNREIKALSEAMKECGLRNGLIITAEQEETMHAEAGVIKVLPAWLWALSEPSNFFE